MCVCAQYCAYVCVCTEQHGGYMVYGSPRYSSAHASGWLLVALCESYDVTHAWPLAYMAHAYGLWHMHVCMHLRFWGNFACFCTQTCSKYLLYINQCMHVDGHVLSHARHMHSANKGQETCHTFSYAHLRMLCACTHSARGCHFLLIRPHCAFAPKTYAFPSWF